MRSAALAVVALVAAALGAIAVLLVGSLTGWIGEGESARTVVVETAPTETGAIQTQSPLLGNGFNPAKIYAGRSGGVVTIYSFFSSGQRSQGSGFVVSDEGHVLTNSHVVTDAGEGEGPVHGASRVYVVFADGDRIPGEIVGWDLFNDIGVVKVDPRDHAVAPLPLGDSSRVVVGEPVAAIGSPFGQESSLAVGVVSATERSIQSLTSDYDVSGAIQVDAPINHGNSGGPLLDARGRVIGINAQIRSDSGNAEGVGFAIPINSARRSMEQLISTGKVTYAYVGVTTQDVTPARRPPLRPRRSERRADPVGRRRRARGCCRPARWERPRALQRHLDQPRRRPDRLLRRASGSSAPPTLQQSSRTGFDPGKPSPSPLSAVAPASARRSASA